MRNFKNLVVWERAHALALALYDGARAFPREELYGITSQIRRAAASIGANLAEGCGRRTDGEFARYLQIATGSASDLTYHLLFARDLHLLEEAAYRQFDGELAEVRKMLTSLTLKVKPAATVNAAATAKS